MATKDTPKEVPALNRRAIFSKTGKGVQESSGKTSHLSRADRAVLKEIDGKTSMADIALKFDNIAAAKFDALILQLDKDGFVREVSSGAAAPEPITPIRKVTPAAPPKATPKPAADAGDGLDFSKAAPPKPASGGDDMDFTQAISLPPKSPAAPKGPAVDLAAAARAQAEAKAKEQAATDYRARQEAEAKAAAEAKARAEAEARARAQAEAKAKADAEARARAEEAKAAEAAARAAAEARAKAEGEAKAKAAEAEAKAKQARDMALRMAAEAKAKAEAESKEKARLEAELKGKLEEERKAREEAERRAAEAAERARKELEEKSKRDAEELRQRLEAEMKAKLEEERKAREEEDRKRKEEHDRREREHERREKEAAERRAKEEAERKQRDEEDRKRREEQERRHKEEDERREKERAERRAKEEAERKEDERREKEREERRAKEEAERKQREERDRKEREEEDRKRRQEAERREKEESERRAREASDRKEETAKPAAPAAAGGGGDFGSLLDDLDSFGQKEEEERKAKEEAERKAKQEAEARARAEEERKRREAEENKRREEEERRARAEAERKAKEEAERREREEEERRKAEEAERKQKAKEALEKKQAEERAAAQRSAEATLPPRSKAPAKPAAKDDIGVSDDDLDMDDIKRDEAAISKESRKAAKDREEAAAMAARPVVPPKKWGKPVAVALFVVLIGGVGALHVMPLSTSDYEKAASEALGVPVKVSSARLSVLTGVKVNLEGVTVGDAKMNVRAFPEIGSLFGAKKIFSRLEIEGATLSQGQFGEAVFGKAGGENFRAGRIVFKRVKLDGPLALAPVDVEATLAGDGSVQGITVKGDNSVTVKITPGTGGNASFELSAPSFTPPFVPGLSLSDFGWKGTATRQGITSSEFDGRAYDGVISGNARVRWGSSWSVEGEVRARAVKVAVFAPTLVSDGKVEGRGNYTMSGSEPAKLGETGKLDGSFKIENGVIGNIDLGRALQTGGAQTQGRTEFAELTGQGVYDKGAVQLRNLSISARAMNAGAALDIDAGGALAGRIAAEVKTPNQTLKAVLNISGSLQNPVVKK